MKAMSEFIHRILSATDELLNIYAQKVLGIWERFLWGLLQDSCFLQFAQFEHAKVWCIDICLREAVLTALFLGPQCIISPVPLGCMSITTDSSENSIRQAVMSRLVFCVHCLVSACKYVYGINQS